MRRADGIHLNDAVAELAARVVLFRHSARLRRAMSVLRGFLGAVCLSALAAAVLAADAPAQSGGVLVVGDSLGVGTGPYLRRELGSGEVTIDAKKSRPSGVGVEVLEERLRPGHRVVVFDLGVNDDPSQPALLEGNLQTVRRIVGDRCLVVATLSRPPVGGVGIDGMNRVIREFVASTPGAQLFDWRAATRRDPDLLGPDGLHPGRGGYAERARMLADVIGGCLAPAGPGRAREHDDDDDDEEEEIPLPRDPVPGPATPSASQRDPLRWQPLVAGLVRRMPMELIVNVARGALEHVEGAGHEMAGAVSPPRAEPTLGAAPGEAPAKKRPRPRRPAR